MVGRGYLSRKPPRHRVAVVASNVLTVSFQISLLLFDWEK